MTAYHRSCNLRLATSTARHPLYHAVVLAVLAVLVVLAVLAVKVLVVPVHELLMQVSLLVLGVLGVLVAYLLLVVHRKYPLPALVLPSKILRGSYGCHQLVD
jgi:hypothetical protein